MLTLPRITSLLAFGVEVTVIPRNGHPVWPFSGNVRYVGFVVAFDSISIAVVGHVERWSSCPDPVPEGWLMVKKKAQKWPWSPVLEVDEPTDSGWVKDKDLSLIVFPMSSVAISLSKTPEGVEIRDKPSVSPVKS